MAGLALDTGPAVRAGMPLVRGGLVAGAAQVCIRLERHRLGRMVWLEWTVAGFAGDAFLIVLAILGVETSRVALQAASLLAQFGPIALEYRGGECPGMPGGDPVLVNILMAVRAGR